MPLPDGTLTDDEFRQVVFKLNEIFKESGGPPVCPTCGTLDFFIHPAILGNRSDTVSVMARHTRLPTVGKYCKKCGHLTEYVASYLGVTVRTVADE